MPSLPPAHGKEQHRRDRHAEKRIALAQEDGGESSSSYRPQGSSGCEAELLSVESSDNRHEKAAGEDGVGQEQCLDDIGYRDGKNQCRGSGDYHCCSGGLHQMVLKRFGIGLAVCSPAYLPVNVEGQDGGGGHKAGVCRGHKGRQQGGSHQPLNRRR